jgi:hypothetical protein
MMKMKRAVRTWAWVKMTCCREKDGEHTWLLVGDERKRQAYGLPRNVVKEGEEHKERNTLPFLCLTDKESLLPGS